MNIKSDLMLNNRTEYLKQIGVPDHHDDCIPAKCCPAFEEIDCEFSQLAYICIFASDYVSVVDIIKGKRLYDIRVGLGPIDIAIDRINQFGFVTNFSANTISKINLNLRKTIATIPVGKSPAGISLSRDGRLLYVVHYGEPSVYVLDACTLNKITEIPLPSIGFQIDLAKNGRLAYVSLRNSSQIAIIDLSINLVVKVIPAGSGTECVRVSPSNQLVCVSNEEGDSITPVNVHLGESGIPYITSPGMPVDMAFTSDSKQLYCANRADDTVSFIDLFTHKVINKISCGPGPYGVEIVPERGRLIVSNTYSNTISIIDTCSNTLRATVTVGYAPAFLAVL